MQDRNQPYLLRLYMARAGVTTAGELAGRVGVSRQTVSAWLNGKAPVGTENLGTLAAQLALTDAELGELTRAAAGQGAA